jgi:hypothetical protein
MAISQIVQNSLADTISLGVKVATINIANSGYSILDDTAVNVGGGFIVITGDGFKSGAQVLVDNVTACSVSVVSGTQIRAEVPAKTAGTYNVYVANSDGATGIKVNGLTYSALPTWVTASALANQYSNIAFTGNFNATGAVLYQLQTGSSFPTGFTLANTANGFFTGNVSVGSETTFNFTVEAIDTENQESPRAFSILIRNSWPSAYAILAAGAQHATDGSAQKYDILLPGDTSVTPTWCKFTGDGYAWMLALSFGGTNIYSDGTLWGSRIYFYDIAGDRSRTTATNYNIRFQKENGDYAVDEDGEEGAGYWAMFPDAAQDAASQTTFQWWAHSSNLGRMVVYGDLTGTVPSNVTHGLWNMYPDQGSNFTEDKIFDYQGNLIHTFSAVNTPPPDSARFALGPLSNTTHGYYQEGIGTTTRADQLWVGSNS